MTVARPGHQDLPLQGRDVSGICIAIPLIEVYTSAVRRAGGT